MQIFFRYLTQLFPLWSVLIAMVALFWPEAFTWCTGTLIRVGLCIIMLGMGLTLNLADLLRLRSGLHEGVKTHWVSCEAAAARSLVSSQWVLALLAALSV